MSKKYLVIIVHVMTIHLVTITTVSQSNYLQVIRLERVIVRLISIIQLFLDLCNGITHQESANILQGISLQPSKFRKSFQGLIQDLEFVEYCI